MKLKYSCLDGGDGGDIAYIYVFMYMQKNSCTHKFHPVLDEDMNSNGETKTVTTNPWDDPYIHNMSIYA